MNDQKICNLIFSKIKKSDNLLDIGCGEGYLCNCLAQKLQKPVAGLDISNKGFNKAHKICRKFNTCDLIECLEGKAEHLEKVVGNKKFDAVTFVHSFHHLDNVRQVLAQIKKVLRKEGKLIIAEYSPERGKNADDCKRFTLKFIAGLLMDSFTNINIEQPEKGFFFLIAHQ
jgi:ubiquinone/menaquinone biosynthesis C-methylase UbiE